MIKYKTLIVSLIYIATSVLNIASAQDKSYVIDGNSITFYYKNDKAESVELKGNFPKEKGLIPKLGSDAKFAMHKQNGLWTCSIHDVPSDMYTYSFCVDDEDDIVLDPLNKDVVRDVDKIYNFLIVPGVLGDVLLEQDVKHGSVEKVWYPSNLKGMAQRRMSVYLPHGYGDSDEQYPVLYLLHGSGGDETSWTDQGRILSIMDNMIAQGRCKPMVVVMPNGNVDLDAAPGESPYMDKKAKAMNLSSMMGQIEEAFPKEVVSYAESHYRIKPGKENRAIAGLSLGGLQTIYITVNNPELFDYIGLFSAQTTNLMNKGTANSLLGVKSVFDGFNSIFGTNLGHKITDKITEVDIYSNIDDKLKVQFANPPKVYYITLGCDDFVKKLNDDYRKRLTKLNIPYQYKETLGGHTWNNWRQYLIDFLPMIFTNK